MLIVAAVVLVLLAFAFPLLVRSSDLPAPVPVSPTLHLEERRSIIYESLRDVQIEYLMGKLSDDDYQATKKDLQQELAEVLARIEEIGAEGQAA